MIKGRLHAVVAAVNDVSAATRKYSDIFGMSEPPLDVLPNMGVKRTAFSLDGTFFELAEPLDAEGPLAKFLKKRGEGIYLVALEVADLDEYIAQLRANGVDVTVPPGPPSSFMLRGVPHKIAFLHPKDTSGIMIELVEPQLD